MTNKKKFFFYLAQYIVKKRSQGDWKLINQQVYARNNASLTGPLRVTIDKSIRKLESRNISEEQVSIYLRIVGHLKSLVE